MSGHRCGRVAKSSIARGARASASCHADPAGHRSPSAHVKVASARGVQAAPAAVLPAAGPALAHAKLWPMGVAPPELRDSHPSPLLPATHPLPFPPHLFPPPDVSLS